MRWDLGVPVLNPMDVMYGLERNTKIIAVFPELHPRVNEYDNKHNFVGQCISEEVRKYDLNEDPGLKSVLDLFPIKGRNIQPMQQHEELKLIYVSLGTLFHGNIFIFEKIIEAFRTYNDKPNRKMKSTQFRVVISTGEKSLKTLNKKISEGKQIIPDYILLRAQVPQLEILKRAHLFVTHSGMNSTSETITYAVPIVSIPLEGDQHMNGKRICDELKLGVRLDARKLNEDSIIEAIDEVLSDDKYAKNIQEMSVISSKYNGAVEGAKIIADFLNQNEAENKLVSTKTKSNQVNPL
jgi:UDP:flavonoid glycosyltransferase YjiC (YdhE family)